MTETNNRVPMKELAGQLRALGEAGYAYAGEAAAEIESLERKVRELEISLRCYNVDLRESDLDNNRLRIVIASMKAPTS